MRPREVFRFDCPCCGKAIEINTRNGKARAVKFEESKKGKSFDGLVQDAKHDTARLGDLFEEAQDLYSGDEERLGNLFEDAKKKAAKDKDKDKKPRGPFDLE